LVEAKQSDWRAHDAASNRDKRALWTEGVPDYYMWQVQTQLLVTGLDFALIFCRLGAADIRMHVVPALPFYQESILNAVEEFYDNLG
jgi:hypothetical protein